MTTLRPPVPQFKTALAVCRKYNFLRFQRAGMPETHRGPKRAECDVTRRSADPSAEDTEHASALRSQHNELPVATSIYADLEARTEATRTSRALKIGKPDYGRAQNNKTGSSLRVPCDFGRAGGRNHIRVYGHNPKKPLFGLDRGQASKVKVK